LTPLVIASNLRNCSERFSMTTTLRYWRTTQTHIEHRRFGSSISDRGCPAVQPKDGDRRLQVSTTGFPFRFPGHERIYLRLPRSQSSSHLCRSQSLDRLKRCLCNCQPLRQRKGPHLKNWTPCAALSGDRALTSLSTNTMQIAF